MHDSFKILTMLMLVLTSFSWGQEAGGSPDEDRPYLYVSTNLLRARHTLSAGYWGSNPKIGLNLTALYYSNIELLTSSFGADPEETINGPRYISLSTSIRYKAGGHLSEFSGIGFSYNRLDHGKDLEYDDKFSFAKFTARPRSNNVIYGQPYATLFIENGYLFSSRGLNMVVGMTVAWHPLVVETWEANGALNGKGYFTPYNIQIRIELGLKKIFG